MTSPATLSAPPANNPDPDDLTLLAEIRAGNLARFDLLVNRYKSPLLRYLFHHVRDPHLAEDLAQETFLKLFRAPPPPLASAQFSTWLFTVARNAAVDHHRAAARRSLNPARVPRPASSLDPAAWAALAEEHTRLIALFAKLPQDQHEVLSLRLLADLSLQQIADITNTTLSTVKSRLRYALAKINLMLPQENRP